MIFLKLLPLVLILILSGLLIANNILSRDSKEEKEEKRLRQEKELDDKIIRLRQQNRFDFVRLMGRDPFTN